MQIMQYVTPADFEGRGLDALGSSAEGDVPAAPTPGYAIDADAAYPAAIQHIQAVLNGQGHPPSLKMYVDRARAIELGEVWGLAQTAYTAFNPNSAADAAKLAARREALEIVRGWCIELLHLAQGYAPMNVKIAGSKDWKTG